VKAKTIDERCGKQQGSFKAFLKEKEDYLRKLEDKRKKRIESARTAREMSWAA
jgi:hypothetical protein